MPNFQSLKIRAYLQSPVITDGYLPIDSILYDTFIREIVGVKDPMQPRTSEYECYEGSFLPIRRTATNSENWFYEASFAMWSNPKKHIKIPFAKRFDTKYALKFGDLSKKRNVIDVARGEFKNAYIQENAIAAEFVEWYVMGNKEEIEMLLSFCNSLGKHRGAGSGAVSKWEVTESVNNYSLIKDGTFTRSIPNEEANTVYGVRPPYWSSKNITNATMPKIAYV